MSQAEILERFLPLSTSPKPIIDKKRSGSSSRRHARQLALQLLFQMEFHQNYHDWVGDFWVNQTATPEEKDFASRIVEGVLAHRTELDAFINQLAVEWTIDRMPVVDRNILRWSVYELLWEPDIPAKVTVNEALELAKRFADNDARRFINGILDHVLQQDPRLESKRADLLAMKKQDSPPASTPHSSTTQHS